MVQLIVFQPDQEFYKTKFNERFKFLSESILTAKSYLDKKNDSTQPCVFVAPEGLFKGFSNYGEERYYQHHQKKAYIKKLKDLSKNSSNLVIIPGTICWKKKAKTDGETYFRNVSYFFYNGVVVSKYKKVAPLYSYDFDYLGSGEFCSNDPRLKFFRSGDTKDCIIKVAGLTIAFDICQDNLMGVAHTALQNYEDSNIDLHITAADGVVNRKMRNLPLSQHARVKIERNPNNFFNTLAGTVELTGDFPLFTESDGEEVAAGLSYYKL